MRKLLANAILNAFIFMSILICNGEAANWYIDKDAAGTNAGTSWSNAWTSFSAIAWSSVSTGDTVYISGGSTSKTYTGALTIGKSGTSDSSRITVRAGQDAGHNGTVIISGASINISNTNYVTVDGEYSGTRHIKIINGNVGANSASYFILRYIEVENAGIGIVATYGNGGRISYCYLHGIDEEAGIRFNARNGGAARYDQTFVDHTTITLNRYADGSGNGPDGIQGCWGLTVEYNTFNNVVGTIKGAQHQDYIQMQANYVTVRGNTFIAGADSLIDYDAWNGQPHHHRIYNNVFIMPRGGGIRYYGGGGTVVTSISEIYILNNTFVDHTSGHQWPVAFYAYNGNPTVSNVFIQNNIFYNFSAQPVITDRSSNATQADWHFDYNLINPGSAGGSGAVINGSSYTQAHPFTATPSFVSYTPRSESSDLHLSSTDTAAKDRGTSLTAYFTIDKDGRPRPQGTAWDIGAYEFTSQSPVPGKIPDYPIPTIN